MKTRVLLLSVFLFSIFSAEAQIWKNMGKKIEKKIEEKASRRVERQIDKAIDKGLDKIEEAPKEAGRSSKKSKGKSGTQTGNDAYEENTMSEFDMDQESGGSNAGLQRYSKFTFVPGEEIIAFDDFSQDAVGDLPASWVSTGTSEVVNFDHVEGNWVWFNKTKGNFVPEYLRDFPENFTLEFDLMYDFEFGKYSHARLFSLVFSDISNPEAKLDWDGGPTYFYLQKLAPNYLSIYFTGNSSDGGPYITGKKAVSANKDLNFSTDYLAKEFINASGANSPIHISISRTGRRMQVFANEEKVLDMTNAFEKEVKLTSARFFVNNHTEQDNYYISNIRYAVGKPDTRNKLLSSGTFTTSAITFTSGSAQIKPESYGILKEIADALKSETGKSVMIIGHTDSDGSDALNQQLSEKRADAVRQALEQEFGVSNAMTTEGKGESAPVADNSTPSGKAQNRRVEFILN
ncbi:OmpA family protein [Sphingobacterium phlebotomi]|uniref:OmpA family protein n=1 Tax=Sphingobacterium phlebotomi TaxID=2605433 RepID=A0A5D4H8E3_9SPHI|nr:OmpA family protein [Sphingobacterium phlebotomi]TYR35110.1 OmpA family protein [Sphingobacterium phlebotomi]